MMENRMRWTLYSLIESCQVVGLNPLAWLTYVLENLRDDTPPDQLKAMLPYNYKKLTNNLVRYFLLASRPLSNGYLRTHTLQPPE